MTRIQSGDLTAKAERFTFWPLAGGGPNRLRLRGVYAIERSLPNQRQ